METLIEEAPNRKLDEGGEIPPILLGIAKNRAVRGGKVSCLIRLGIISGLEEHCGKVIIVKNCPTWLEQGETFPYELIYLEQRKGKGYFFDRTRQQSPARTGSIALLSILNAKGGYYVACLGVGEAFGKVKSMFGEYGRTVSTDAKATRSLDLVGENLQAKGIQYTGVYSPGDSDLFPKLAVYLRNDPQFQLHGCSQTSRAKGIIVPPGFSLAQEFPTHADMVLLAQAFIPALRKAIFS